MIIRPYRAEDEQQWLRWRVLSFLDTAYYDNVLQEKEKYDHEAIELVATIENQIVGLIDIELEEKPGSICSDSQLKSGMIWHIAVHPDFRRRGVARNLLSHSIQLARTQSIQRIEAWTRDDKWVMEWYERMGFSKKSSYLQVFAEGKNELREMAAGKIPGLYLVTS